MRAPAATTGLTAVVVAGWMLWQIETGHFANAAQNFARWLPRGTFDTEAACRAQKRAEVGAAQASMPKPGDSLGDGLHVTAWVKLPDGYTVGARQPRAFVLTTRFECHRASFDPRR